MVHRVTMDDDLTTLLDVVARDDWDGLDQWALGHLEKGRLAGAAELLCEALEHDRHRHQEAAMEGSAGIPQAHQTLARGIARVWELGARGGAVREIRAAAKTGYAVVVEGSARVALVSGRSRATIVASDASAHYTPRSERQLGRVLAALVHPTSDLARVGRQFGLVVGSINSVDLRSGTCPLWPSRWRIGSGAELAPWLAEGDVVAAFPAGGRVGLAGHVVQLEQAVDLVLKDVWLERQQGPALDDQPAGRAVEERRSDRILDLLELLEAWSWRAEVEPLRPRTGRVIEAIRAGARAEELHALATELLANDEAPFG